VNGQDFSGTVTILVSSPIASTIYYSTESTAVVLNASDLSQTCLSTTGQSLSSIRFTSLPSSSCGQMLSGYTGLGTGTTVRTSDVFSVSDASALRQLAFVPKAGFSGQVSLSYQGSDTSGASYSGTIVIAVTPTGSASRFADMTYYSWAAPAVEFLAENGVVSGISTEEYGPSLVVQRGAFATMLANAFQLPTTYGASSFSDVSSSSYYSGAVAAAKNLGIVAGTNGLFLPNNQVTRQDAAVMLYRAMQVAGYALPNYNSDALSAFSDGGQVSDYAQEALSTLVQLGVMQGNSSGQLCPNSPMTRAELAVVLHQILTL
jgi:hypothetical protein